MSDPYLGRDGWLVLGGNTVARVKAISVTNGLTLWCSSKLISYEVTEEDHPKVGTLLTREHGKHVYHVTRKGALKELQASVIFFKERAEKDLANWVKWEEELTDEISKEESCTSAPTS